MFPGEERQLREVRYWVASVLPPAPARDDVVTVASELGANAIRHTASGQGGKFTVEVTWQRAVLRVAVTDGGGSADPRVIDDPAAEHGRGLLLVRGLSVRLGVDGDQRGRVVWADISWDDQALLLPLRLRFGPKVEPCRRRPSSRGWRGSTRAWCCAN